MSSLNGVVPVDKPAGPSSHDVVALARRALRERRIGHTGTLDPFASGLLLLCVGPSTRLAEYLTALPKRYAAVMRLGVTTDTDDDQGAVIAESEGWRSLSLAEVEDAFARQVGEILQVPPRYSAKRVAGERMYDVARRGGEVVLEPVPVTVREITVTRFDPPDVVFEVACSSGTYIRAIARDAGAALGVGAHLVALRRTHVGAYDVADSLEVPRLDDAEAVAAALVAPADAVGHLPRIPLRAAQVAAVRNGIAVAAPEDTPPAAGPVSLTAPDGALVAIGEVVGGLIRPRKVFA